MVENIVTRVIVNITRHETCEYVFEGAVNVEQAYELIGSGQYEPAVSDINHEDIDILDSQIIHSETPGLKIVKNEDD